MTCVHRIRVKMGKSANPLEEPSIELFILEGSKETDPVWGLWPDDNGPKGSWCSPVMGRLVKDHLGKQVAGKKRRVPLFSAEHVATHNKIVVKTSQDAKLGPRVMLFDQSSQKCQILLKVYGDDPNAETKGVAIMTKLAEIYVQDQVKVEDLDDRRNELLLEAGITYGKARPQAHSQPTHTNLTPPHQLPPPLPIIGWGGASGPVSEP